MANKLEIGYWGIRGLGAPLRMMALYAKAPVFIRCYDLLEKPEGGYACMEWFAERKPALKAINPLINLPYIVDGDTVITQTNACMAYLGRKLKLWGDSPAESLMCDQLLCEIYDLRCKMTGFSYSGVGEEAAKAGALGLLDEVINSPNGTLQKLELILAMNKAGEDTFFVGGHATAPDFHAWELLDQYTKLAKFFAWQSGADPLGTHPHIAAFYKKFAALPANSTYLKSGEKDYCSLHDADQ